MSEIRGETVSIRLTLRQDVSAALDDKLELFLKAAQSHINDALCCTLTIHERFECSHCMEARMLPDFFDWINEEGYCYIVDDLQYTAFMREASKWAIGWTEEQMLSPCTDGAESTQIH